MSSTTTRVRPPAATAETPDVEPLPMARWRGAALSVSAKSTAMRGGLPVVKMRGCGTGPLAKAMCSSTAPPGSVS